MRDLTLAPHASLAGMQVLTTARPPSPQVRVLTLAPHASLACMQVLTTARPPSPQVRVLTLAQHASRAQHKEQAAKMDELAAKLADAEERAKKSLADYQAIVNDLARVLRRACKPEAGGRYRRREPPLRLHRQPGHV